MTRLLNKAAEVAINMVIGAAIAGALGLVGLAAYHVAWLGPPA